MTRMKRKERQLCRQTTRTKTPNLDYMVSFPPLLLLLSLPLSSPLPSSHPHLFDVTDVMVSRRTDRERIPVRYCNLGTRDAARYHLTWLLSQLCAWSESEYDERCACVLRDPHTLVELSAFSAINRFQPFNVAVSSNVLLLMVSINTLSSRPAPHWSQVKRLTCPLLPL